MIDEQFRGWVTAPVSMPSVPRDLQAAPCEPEDLAEMIELVRAAEMACVHTLQKCSRRTRPAQETTHTDEWSRTLQLLAWQRETIELDTRLKWLQAVRQQLTKQQQRAETARVAR